MRLPTPMTASDPLQGNWSATRWQYRSMRDRELSIDVVCEQGASVTLSFGADFYVLTCDPPPPGHRTTEGGAFALNGEMLELHPHPAGPPKSVRWLLSQDTLTLRSEQTTCDFDDSRLNEPASLVAVLVRV